MSNNIPSGKTILWADDDADDLMLMHDVLKETDQHYEIVEVPNGRKALEYLKSCTHYPCLIILDMNMPIMNGQETLSIIKLHEQYKNIPVVVFTTSNSEMDRVFCKKYGVEMITKPPEYRSFHKIVLKMLNYCDAASS